MALDEAAKAPARPQKTGAKVRLVSMQDLDNRTKAAQLAVATKEAIIADLGGAERLSTLELIMAENAAMASAVLTDLHVRWLKGEDISVSDMNAMTNSFNRTAQALGTQRRPADTMTIDSYLKKDVEA